MPDTMLISIGLWIPCILAANTQDFGAWNYPALAQIDDTIYAANGLQSSPNGSIAPSFGVLYNITLGKGFTEANAVAGLSWLEQMSYTSTPTAMTIGGTIFSNRDALVTIGGVWYPSHSVFTDTPFVILDHPTQQDQRSPVDFIQLDAAELAHGAPWQIAFGASTSVPSEDLAFYFGGLSTSTGVFPSYDGNASDTANITVDVMYSCNTSSFNVMQCSNIMLPENIISRAEGNMVWIPVGTHGLLVIIGGIQNPADISTALSTNATNYDSTFLSQLPVFDIASQHWYIVSAQLDPRMPSAIASSCILAASASDRSSFQIYVYGGYDGTYTSEKAFSQIWALSVPSFKWYPISISQIQVKRRMSHACLQPFPNIFFAFGGSTEFAQPLQAPVVDVFDLNAGNWTGKYDPNPDNYEYLVPSQIVADIGGSQHGGATKTASMAPELSTVFAQPYRGNIPTYYPYVSYTGRAEAVLSQWFSVVIGITIYLLIASAAIVLLILLRRRKLIQASKVDTSDIKSGNYVVRWMNNAEVKKKDTAVEEVELVKQDDIELSSLEGGARSEILGTHDGASQGFESSSRLLE